MKQTIKHYLHRLRAHTLTSQEKERLFARINTYTHTHPQRKRSIFWQFTYASLSVQKVFVIVIIALGMIAGGISYTAAHVLPGDILYGVKISNEHMKEYMSLSLEKKAQLQKVHIQNRLEEANTLLKNDSLDVEKQEIVGTRLQEQMRQLLETLADLKTIDTETAISISTTMAQTMGAHQEVLATLSTEEAKTLLRNIQEGLTTSESQVELVLSDLDMSDTKQKDLTKSQLAHAKEAVEQVSMLIDEKEVFKLLSDIDLATGIRAEYHIRAADVAIENEEYEVALREAVKAHIAAGKILQRVEVEENLKLTEASTEAITTYEQLEEELDALAASTEATDEESSSEAKQIDTASTEASSTEDSQPASSEQPATSEATEATASSTASSE